MKRLPDFLAAIATTAWVGGMWAVGFLAAPVLFYKLTDRQLAGSVAGEMFRLVAWTGLVCGAYLVIWRFARFGARAMRTFALWATGFMLVLTLIGHFGIQPILEHLKAQAMPQAVMESMFRNRFARWHGVANAVYILQSLIGLVLILEPQRKRSAR